MVRLAKVERCRSSRFKPHGILLLFLAEVFDLREGRPLFERLRVVHERLNDLLPVRVRLFEELHVRMLHPLRRVAIDQVSVVLHLLAGPASLGSTSRRLRFILFFWRVFHFLVQADEELVSDLSLGLFEDLQRTALSVNDAENGLPGLPDHLAHVDHALIGVLNLGLLGFDDSVVPRVVHHDEEVAFLDIHLKSPLIIIKL